MLERYYQSEMIPLRNVVFIFIMYMILNLFATFCFWFLVGGEGDCFAFRGQNRLSLLKQFPNKEFSKIMVMSNHTSSYQKRPQKFCEPLHLIQLTSSSFSTLIIRMTKKRGMPRVQERKQMKSAEGKQYSLLHIKSLLYLSHWFHLVLWTPAFWLFGIVGCYLIMVEGLKMWDMFRCIFLFDVCWIWIHRS